MIMCHMLRHSAIIVWYTKWVHLTSLLPPSTYTSIYFSVCTTMLRCNQIGKPMLMESGSKHILHRKIGMLLIGGMLQSVKFDVIVPSKLTVWTQNRT